MRTIGSLVCSTVCIKKRLVSEIKISHNYSDLAHYSEVRRVNDT